MARSLRRGPITQHMLVIAYRYHAIFGQHIVVAEDLPKFYTIDVYDEWQKFRSHYVGWHPQSAFLDHLRSLVSDPDSVDDYVRFCDDCEIPSDDDNLHWLDAYDKSLCEDCLDSYPACNDCGDHVHRDYLCWVMDERVCENCLEYNYNYCDQCDSYYSSNDYCCDQDCDCEAPAQTFSIRNDGNEPLKNDTRTTMSLAAGVISEEGLNAIYRLLIQEARNPDVVGSEPRTYGDYGSPERAAYEEYSAIRTKWYTLAQDILDGKIGADWQAKDGNFTKRLSRYAYKAHGLKVRPEVISEVGNIGSQHSQGASFAIEVTRNLNLPAYEFAHEDSCWWQSYHSSRCALKNNGGFGLRSFNEYGVTGRAWVMPLKRTSEDSTMLEPTFDVETADAYVVFNGYGDLSGYGPARIVAHMVGMTYRKVCFYADPMYVNGESGYLIAPEDIADGYTDGTLSLNTPEHSSLYSREVASGRVAA